MHIISTKTLNGHTEWVSSVFAINNIIISSSDDRTIKIWDINTAKCINTFNGHTEAVYSVFAINNIISGSEDNSIKIWNASTGELINTLNSHTDCVNSVIAIDNIIISGSCDKSIKIIEYITNEQIFTALCCMWKLGYPNEIIHEIFKWLGIDTYA